MFFSKGCWAYGHLDLWNKHPLMEQRRNSRATDNDTKQTETEQREGTSSGTSSLMTALVFMIVSKPTENWDENVFLKPFTDVKIRSQSQLSEYTEGCQQRVMWRTKHQGKKKTLALYSVQKSPRSYMFVTFISITSTVRLVVSMGFSQRGFHFGSWKNIFSNYFFQNGHFSIWFPRNKKESLMFLMFEIADNNWHVMFAIAFFFSAYGLSSLCLWSSVFSSAEEDSGRKSCSLLPSAD